MGFRFMSMMRESSIDLATNFPEHLEQLKNLLSFLGRRILIAQRAREQAGLAVHEFIVSPLGSPSRHSLSFFLENSFDTVE